MWSPTVFITLFLSGGIFGLALAATLVVHPAMLRISRSAAVELFTPFYQLSFKWQLPLSIVASLGALVAAYLSSNWYWLIGVALMQANGPYTAKAMMPTNRRLMDETLDPNSKEAEADLTAWGKLHLVRTALNGLAVCVFLALALWSTP